MFEHVFAGMTLATKVVRDSPILLQYSSGKVYVGTYSQTHTFIYTAEVPDLEPFRAVVSYETAKHLTSHFYGGTLDFSDTSVGVVLGKNKAKFSLYDNDTRMSLKTLAEKYTDDEAVTINPVEFKRLYDETKYASNSSQVGDIRFQGFHLAFYGNKTEVVATDGNIIALAATTHPGKPLDEPLVFINNPEFESIAGIMGGASDLKISFATGDTISLTADFPNGATVRVVSSLITGDPVPYNTVLERVTTANTSEYTLRRAEFLTVLSTVPYFAEGDSNKNKVNLRIEGDSCAISATNERGSTTVEAPITEISTDQDVWSINIDLAYLMAYLKSSKLQDITLRVGGDKLPILLESGTSTGIITVKSG